MRRAIARLSPQRLRDPEITHDIVVRIMRTLGSWRGSCALRTWVFRITKNELVRRTSAADAARRSGEQAAADDPSPWPTPEELLAAQEERCRFAAALSRIALRRRLCFLGLTVLGLGAKEVAAWPGVGGSAVSVRQAASKARAQIRLFLGPRPSTTHRSVPLPVCEVCDCGCTAHLDGWLRCPVVVPAGLDVRLAQERGSR